MDEQGSASAGAGANRTRVGGRESAGAAANRGEAAAGALAGLRDGTRVLVLLRSVLRRWAELTRAWWFSGQVTGTWDVIVVPSPPVLGVPAPAHAMSVPVTVQI